MNIAKTGSVAVMDPNEVSAGSTTSKKDPLLEFIKRRHPTYEQNEAHWRFLESCYQGGREWFSTNIFQYIKEGEGEFQNRLNRAYRFNHTREVVDLVNKYLFKQEVARNAEDAPDSVKTFWANSSKQGLDIADLARQMSSRTSMQGRIGIVVDNNNVSKVLTQAEQKSANVKIYAYVVRPEELLDYAFDDAGELLWVKIAEVKRDDVDPINSTGVETIQYRLWTREDWTLYEVRKVRNKKTVVEVASGEHNLGEVPVILMDCVISDRPYDSPALVDDIAYLDRAVANYLSNLDAIIQDQTFSQLVMPAQSLMPGEDAYAKVVEMGTKRVFLFDGQGGAAPAYISPDVKQAELIVNVINKIINEIYHTVGLAGERTKQDNAVGIDNSSGVAKAFDFEKVNALLSSKAHSLENAENKLARLVAKWAGDTLDKDLVTYPDNFDTRGLYDEFEIAGTLALVGAPDSARRAQMEMLVGKLFPQLSKELKESIKKELVGWPIKEDLNAPAGGQLTTKESGSQGAVGSEKKQNSN